MADNSNDTTTLLNKSLDFAAQTSHTVGEALTKVTNMAVDTTHKYGPQLYALVLHTLQLQAILQLVLYGFVPLALAIIATYYLKINVDKGHELAWRNTGKYEAGMIFSALVSGIFSIWSLVNLLDYQLWIMAIDPQAGLALILINKVTQ